MLLRNCAVIGNGMIAKRTLAKILEARVVDHECLYVVKD